LGRGKKQDTNGSGISVEEVVPEIGRQAKEMERLLGNYRSNLKNPQPRWNEQRRK